MTDALLRDDWYEKRADTMGRTPLSCLTVGKKHEFEGTGVRRKNLSAEGRGNEVDENLFEGSATLKGGGSRSKTLRLCQRFAEGKLVANGSAFRKSV